MIASIVKFFFGTANQRRLKKIQPLVDKINLLEPSIQILTDEELKAKTAEFRGRYASGESLDSLLPEAFAVVREASKRVLGERHYDVQLIGGIVLHQGSIAEMKTGEGKTLTSTLALYLNALSGKGVHLVTVNEYLAERDAAWMGKVYSALDITVGALKNSMYDAERKQVYECDIVYGINSEFGFDYLRDNMKFRLQDYVQRELNFAIVDEVDSILIDEARTPLIISGAVDDNIVEEYKRANSLVKRFAKNIDFEVDEKERNVFLTEEGVNKVEAFYGIENLYAPINIKTLHHIMQALKAHSTFARDVEYMVVNGEVLIVDEFTGRVLPGRRYSDGLHQALEAKEGVEIQEETQTLASITIQNYFRLYKKLSGMTGTALTEAEEFHKIYNLDVVSIPTNRKVQRDDKNDLIFLSEPAKFKQIVTDIKERHAKGQPVLIGTVAVETSERLSNELQKAGIKHNVLNAKYHERESEIVAEAGHAGRITIATNMAGRGTDIKLTPESKAAGGLYILGTERHESRRIDNQLRGRSGRQGDPGESRFYISLEDSLIKRFAGDTLKNMMQRVGMKDDEVIEDNRISKRIEVAQEKVEKYNFEARKHVIEYDDVLNMQRKVIYDIRKVIISNNHDMLFIIKDFIKKYATIIVSRFSTEDGKILDNGYEEIVELVKKEIGEPVGSLSVIDFASAARRKDRAIEILYGYLMNIADTIDAKAKESVGDNEEAFDLFIESKRWLLLEIIDQAWRQHIVNLDHIREGIGLRGYGQKTPIIEYKQEAYNLFKNMSESLIVDSVTRLLKMHGADSSILDLKNKKLQEMKDLERMVHEIAKMRAEGDDAPTGDGSFADFTKFLETMKQKLDQEKQKGKEPQNKKGNKGNRRIGG